jgi:hypothetical protein
MEYAAYGRSLIQADSTLIWSGFAVDNSYPGLFLLDRNCPRCRVLLIETRKTGFFNFTAVK